MDTREQQLLTNDIREIFNSHPAATQFVLMWTDYVHYIDDLVDGDVELNPENIIGLAAKAITIHSTEFFRQYAHILSVVELLINSAYADSVVWEKSTEEWKKIASDTIRHEGLNMFFTVVMIIAGRDKMRSISARMREYTHFKHINDILDYGIKG